MPELQNCTVKRLAGDLRKFKEEKFENFKIYPNPSNMLEIHFLMKGEKDSPYNGGEYLGVIIHHYTYPAHAPDYMMLTPNGRFHLNAKICLTNSGYHQSEWTPAAWNLATLLKAFSSVWHSNKSDDNHGIGHLTTSESEIKRMAKESVEWNKKHYSSLLEKMYN